MTETKCIEKLSTSIHIGPSSTKEPDGRLLVLCYSDRHTSEPIPPHRMSRAELASCFVLGWSVEDIQPVTATSNLHAAGVAAWLAACTRI